MILLKYKIKLSNLMICTITCSLYNFIKYKNREHAAQQKKYEQLSCANTGQRKPKDIKVKHQKLSTMYQRDESVFL